MARYEIRRDGNRGRNRDEDDILFLTEYGRANCLMDQRCRTCGNGDIDDPAYYYRTIGWDFNIGNDMVLSEDMAPGRQGCPPYDDPCRGGRMRHEALSGRSCPNQHPISAITGLEERLREIEENVECVKKSATPIVRAVRTQTGNLFTGRFERCLRETEGEILQFIMTVNEPNTASAALKIDGLPEAVLVKQSGSIISALSPFDLIVGMYYHIVFDPKAMRYILIE